MSGGNWATKLFNFSSYQFSPSRLRQLPKKFCATFLPKPITINLERKIWVRWKRRRLSNRLIGRGYSLSHAIQCQRHRKRTRHKVRGDTDKQRNGKRNVFKKDRKNESEAWWVDWVLKIALLAYYTSSISVWLLVKIGWYWELNLAPFIVNFSLSLFVSSLFPQLLLWQTYKERFNKRKKKRTSNVILWKCLNIVSTKKYFALSYLFFYNSSFLFQLKLSFNYSNSSLAES